MYSSSFLTWELDGVNCQRHAPTALYLRVWTSGTHWIGGLVGIRVVWIQMLEEKFFAYARDRTPVVQSVIKNCTD
jgi:hypothetical protein